MSALVLSQYWYMHLVFWSFLQVHSVFSIGFTKYCDSDTVIDVNIVFILS